MALRLDLQKAVSHRISSTAVCDLSGCYKLIVFDLFDAFDCQGTCTMWLLAECPTIASIQQRGVIMHVYVVAQGQFNSNCVVYQLVRVVDLFSGLQRRTVCWHVCVFVQPRFSSSTECIYRTTPSNPNHGKVACTDTQAICFPIMFLCDSVERALKQHTKREQCFLFFFFSCLLLYCKN